jgi:ATP-binding cassette, subfamily B (MDR/TAP), member 1
VRLVQQEPVLFQGSVFDNIRHGLVGTEWENASSEKQIDLVQSAAKMAFAHDFISELPNGYDTQIGQRGSLLSGGQKQRVAIARSVVSQPKVLLLDEATSALDPHAEGIVQQALDKAAEGRTTVVIAHKLATIRKADNIVVMHGGHIHEQGTHESLIAKNGAYARLVQIQSLSIGNGDPEAGVEEDPNSDEDKAEPEHLSKPLTRYTSSVQARMEVQKEHDNYDNHRQSGLLKVVIRLINMTPELCWWYILVLLGCIGAGKPQNFYLGIVM